MTETTQCGPASEKLAMFLQSEAKIVVYGGELRLHSKLS